MTYLKGITRGLIGISALCIIACGGGGGTTATGNPFSGNYTGTFSWRSFNPGGGSNEPKTGTATATVGNDGAINVRINFSDGYDRLLGNVQTNGTATGAYYYNIQDGVEPPRSSQIHTHESTFSRSGGNVIINFNGYPNDDPDFLGWSGTVTLNRS